MAVVSVTQQRVAPEEWDAFLALQKRAKALLERHGASNYRLMVGMTAGEASGSVAATFEAASFEALGAINDKIIADPEGAALITEAPTWQSSAWLELEV